jgi:hypothetical protein
MRMKSGFVLLISFFIGAATTEASGFRLDHEYGTIYSHVSEVCIEGETFYLKDRTLKVCTSRNYKPQRCPSHLLKEVTPSRPQTETVKVCVKWRRPKGSSPVCERHETRVQVTPLEQTWVEFRRVNGSRYSRPVEMRTVIPICEN